MDEKKIKGVIEAVLFSAGRDVKIEELITVVEKNPEEIIKIVSEMQEEYKKEERGIEIIKIGNSYQLTTKIDLYDYIYPIIDKRARPNLSTAALETISIIAYNPKISRPEIEAIRGVNCDGVMYKLLEYNLIECVGKSDLPGKMSIYSVTDEFFRMFGFSSLEELPKLPQYKLDNNNQIIIEETTS